MGEPVDKSDADATAGMGDLEHELSFLVRRIEAVQRHRTYPLMRAHYLVLLILERDGPQPYRHIATELALDASTITRQVAVMMKQNLVTKQNHPGDKRSAILHATDYGRQQMQRMRTARLARVRHLFADWKPGERCRLASLIARLNNSLTTTLNEASTPP